MYGTKRALTTTQNSESSLLYPQRASKCGRFSDSAGHWYERLHVPNAKSMSGNGQCTKEAKIHRTSWKTLFIFFRIEMWWKVLFPCYRVFNFVSGFDNKI